jgi:hypothetical protein
MTETVRGLAWRPIVMAGLVSVGLALIATWLIDLLLSDGWLALGKTETFRNQLNGLKSTAWAAVVPLFIFLRDALGRASGTAPPMQTTRYQFWMFGIVSGLIVVMLAQGFSFLVALLHIFVQITLAEQNVTMNEIISIKLLVGMHSIILPIMFLASIAIGWSLHKRQLDRPFLCMLVVAFIVLLMRGVDMYLLGDLLNRSNLNPGMLVGLGVLPLTCLFGMLLAYFGRGAAAHIGAAVASRL